MNYNNLNFILVLLLVLLISNHIICNQVELGNKNIIYENTLIIRQQLDLLVNSGRLKEVINKLASLENKYGSLQLDNHLPSLYLYKGLAYHGLHRLPEAEESFTLAIKYNPNDTRSWINKGEMLTLQMKFNESVPCFLEAYTLGERLALTRLLSSKGWIDSWDNFEYISAEVENEAYHCYTSSSSFCYIESAFGFEYTDIPGYITKYIYTMASYSKDSRFLVHPHSKSILSKQIGINNGPKRLKLGVISSDFGVHPVSSLIRGLLQLINKTEIELFCFSVTGDLGWWGVNISLSVEHFDILSGVNTQEGASIIASKKIDILIDLNGHTKNSGLSYMSHKPAPIQLSYLGLPSTTGSTFINYYIGDYIALPPEISSHFTEKLLLLSPSYIVNDYINLQGEIVTKFSDHHRMSKSNIVSDNISKLIQSRLLYGTISNSQKLDPCIFTVWMNILSKYNSNNLLFVEHKGYDSAIINLRKYSLFFGIKSDRLLLTPHTPWIDHIYKKTAIDLLFDTITKNGHTTGLDGIWAGVPVISLAGGRCMPQRAGESIAIGMNNEIGLVYSLKEYEDLIDKLSQGSSSNRFVDNFIRFLNIINGLNDTVYFNTDITNNNSTNYSGIQLLRKFRDKIQSDRLKSKLFNTNLYTYEFTRKIQSVYDAVLLSIYRSNNSINNTDSHQEYFYGGISIRTMKSNSLSITKNPNKYHVFARVSQFNKINPLYSKISLQQVYDYRSEVFKSPNSVNDSGISDNNIRLDSSIFNTIFPSETNNNQAVNTTVTINNYLYSYLNENSFESVPDGLLDNELIYLNIGGMVKTPSWLNVNVQDQPYKGMKTHTDLIRPMHNLHGFPNYSVAAIYSSHNLEHNPIGNKMLFQTLTEWRRVLRPAGLLMISVPDLRTMAKIYLNDSLSFQDRWMTTMMIYGSQSNAFDYHFIGFDEEILTSFLVDYGFCNIERVQAFNLFEDASTIVFQGYSISLNIAAKKCITEEDLILFDGELKDIKHNATPYIR